MEFSYTLYFVIILSAVHSGQSLQCYSCSSKKDPSCMEDDKLESFKTDCDSKATEEIRRAFNTMSSTTTDWGNKLGLNLGKSSSAEVEYVCQKVEAEEKDKKYTVRGCSIAKKDSENMCDFIKKTMHTEQFKINGCSQCSEDHCNSSNNVTPAFLTVLITLVAALFYSQ